jgi:hypothetical protein
LDEVLYGYNDKIFELHLSENGGILDEHNINRDDSWQIEFLKRHREIIGQAPVVFEWESAESVQEISDAYCRIRDASEENMQLVSAKVKIKS